MGPDNLQARHVYAGGLEEMVFIEVADHDLLPKLGQAEKRKGIGIDKASFVRC